MGWRTGIAFQLGLLGLDDSHDGDTTKDHRLDFLRNSLIGVE